MLPFVKEGGGSEGETSSFSGELYHHSLEIGLKQGTPKPYLAKVEKGEANGKTRSCAA